MISTWPASAASCSALRRWRSRASARACASSCTPAGSSSSVAAASSTVGRFAACTARSSRKRARRQLPTWQATASGDQPSRFSASTSAAASRSTRNARVGTACGMVQRVLPSLSVARESAPLASRVITASGRPCQLSRWRPAAGHARCGAFTSTPRAIRRSRRRSGSTAASTARLRWSRQFGSGSAYGSAPACSSCRPRSTRPWRAASRAGVVPAAPSPPAARFRPQRGTSVPVRCWQRRTAGRTSGAGATRCSSRCSAATARPPVRASAPSGNRPARPAAPPVRPRRSPAPPRQDHARRSGRGRPAPASAGPGCHPGVRHRSTAARCARPPAGGTDQHARAQHRRQAAAVTGPPAARPAAAPAGRGSPQRQQCGQVLACDHLQRQQRTAATPPRHAQRERRLRQCGKDGTRHTAHRSAQRQHGTHGEGDRQGTRTEVSVIVSRHQAGHRRRYLQVEPAFAHFAADLFRIGWPGGAGHPGPPPGRRRASPAR